jgi:mobilome CxxCx(11)CxxC protein
LLVGGLVMAYGHTSDSVTTLLPYAALLGVCQLVLSLWSLSSDWSGRLQRSSERIWVNHELAKGFEALGRTPPESPSEFQRQFDLLAAEERLSERTDYQLGITSAEKRAGYRAASCQFRRPCATCRETAVSTEPSSDCPVCGEPPRWWRRRPSWQPRKETETSSAPETANDRPAETHGDGPAARSRKDAAS